MCIRDRYFLFFNFCLSNLEPSGAWNNDIFKCPSSKSASSDWKTPVFSNSVELSDTKAPPEHPKVPRFQRKAPFSPVGPSAHFWHRSWCLLKIWISQSRPLPFCFCVPISSFIRKSHFWPLCLLPAYVKRMFLLKTTAFLWLRSCLNPCFSSLVMSYVDIISDSAQRLPAFIPARILLL